MEQLKKKLQETEPYIVELRRWFHEHPEVSKKEKETSSRIKSELEKMGIPYVELKPGYGLAATIQGKGEGKTIAARADFDALPVTENTGLEFSSANSGVMHACGHDTHAAMLLGAAKVLSEMKDEWSGTVTLIFQAEEEIGEGHEEVLEYLESIGGVDQVIGLHIWSDIPEGEILLLPEAVFGGVKGFICTVTGSGGHGARPDLVNDPIKAACELVLKFSSIPSNFYDVMDHSVVSTGMIHAGTLSNIFPSEAVFRGSARYYKRDGGQAIVDRMNQIAAGIGAVYGVDVDVNIYGGALPVYNQPALIQKARELVSQVDGLEISGQTDPISAGDNFCFLVDKYPGFYGILGGGKKGEKNYPQHHEKFDIDEQALRKGSEFMVRYILDYLK